MQSSWCYHPDAAISKKSTNVSPYQLDTSVLMLPSQCHIAESKEMVHNTTLNALRFLVNLDKRNKHVVRKKSKWWKEKIVPAILMHKPTIRMLPSWCYHPDMTILKLPSWSKHPDATIPTLPSRCYCPKATIPILLSRCYCPDATILMLPSQCYHPDVTITTLPSWRYQANVTITMLPSPCYCHNAWCYHHNATITCYFIVVTIRKLPSQCYCLDATVPMLSLQCCFHDAIILFVCLSYSSIFAYSLIFCK